MTLPDTKDDLENVLMRLWALPAHFVEAYRLYALEEKKQLAAFLNWLAGRANELSPVEPVGEDEEDPSVDDDGNWIDPDYG